jgi:hypothetical protein
VLCVLRGVPERIQQTHVSDILFTKICVLPSLVYLTLREPIVRFVDLGEQDIDMRRNKLSGLFEQHLSVEERLNEL